MPKASQILKLETSCSELGCVMVVPIVNGFVRDVLQHLPMEFMAESQKLIGISVEGSVG